MPESNVNESKKAIKVDFPQSVIKELFKPCAYSKFPPIKVSFYSEIIRTDEN